MSFVYDKRQVINSKLSLSLAKQRQLS